jgi:hypothetical protein
MKNWKIILLIWGMGLLIAGCAPACTEQNKAKFVTDVAQINNSWDRIEFNLAYSAESKASQLQQLRGQANLLYTPVCADSLKALLLQSLDERFKNIGNYDNKPRPVTVSLEKEFKAFQVASIAQLNGQVNLLTNDTALYWLAITLIIVGIALLLGFGAYFYFIQGRPRHS